jgi:hypothetical protein
MRASVDRGVAVGRVEQVPVARRQLGQQRQHGVAEQAHRRHRADLLEVEEAVALGVVGLAVDDGGDEVGDQRRVHLAVAVDLDDDVDALGDGRLVAAHHGAADALVDGVFEHGHPRVGAVGAHEVARAVGALVVDHVDALHLRADGGQHAQDVARHAVAGDDHGDARRGLLLV